jgi:hypothetical protein
MVLRGENGTAAFPDKSRNRDGFARSPGISGSFSPFFSPSEDGNQSTIEAPDWSANGKLSRSDRSVTISLNV